MFNFLSLQPLYFLNESNNYIKIFVKHKYFSGKSNTIEFTNFTCFTHKIHSLQKYGKLHEKT